MDSDAVSGTDTNLDEILSASAASRFVGRSRDWLKVRIDRGELEGARDEDGEYQIRKSDLLALADIRPGFYDEPEPATGGEAEVIDLRNPGLDPDETSGLAEHLYGRLEEVFDEADRKVRIAELEGDLNVRAVELEQKAKEISRLQDELKRDRGDLENSRTQTQQLESDLSATAKELATASAEAAGERAKASAIAEQMETVRADLAAANDKARAEAERAAAAEAVLGPWAKRKLRKRLEIGAPSTVATASPAEPDPSA